MASFVSENGNSWLMQHLEEPVSCTCHGNCVRNLASKRRKGGCPCKDKRVHCNTRCKCGTKKSPCLSKPQEDITASESTSTDTEDESSNAEDQRGQQVNPPVSVTDELENSHEAQIQAYVKGLSRDELEKIAVELLRRQPDSYPDLTAPMDVEADVEQNDEASAVPLIQWCKCQMCRPMPLEIENKCCTRRAADCISTSEAFRDICLNAHVLGVNMRVREDELALEENRTNANYRHYAYRNYIYWKYGRLGRGNRVVLPACCVRKIRERFPSANGQYRGFIPGENLQD